MSEIKLIQTELNDKLDSMKDGFTKDTIPSFGDIESNFPSTTGALNIMNQMLDTIHKYHQFLKSDIETFKKVGQIIYDTDKDVTF